MIDLPPLYPFQDAGVNALRQKIREGKKAVVLSAPTGSGKTVMAQYLISSAYSKRRNVTFVVDRRTLLEQTSRRFEEANMEHGIIAGSVTRGPSQPIKIAMAQTLRTQGWPTVQDLVIVDECHVRSKAVLDLLKDPPCPIIGLTATPMVKGLGADDMYEDIVSVATTQELIEDGKLAPLEISQCVEIDMTGAPVNTMGEWSNDTVQERSRQIIGDIVPTWVEQTNKHFGGPVQTMLFSASIAHGEELCREFQAAGYDFRQVTGKDDDDLRNETVEDFRQHKFPGIVSVEALAKGSDFPTVECLVIARPYRKALAAHIQMLGRGMRSSPDKKKCLLRGTKILTDKGLVPIEHITLDHRLWDGHSWVNHGGAVCQGVRPVMAWDGITATADHEVMTENGWKTIGEAADRQERIVKTGLGEHEIRLSDNRIPQDRGKQLQSAGRSILRALRAETYDALSQHAKAAIYEGMSALQPAGAGQYSSLAVSESSVTKGTLRKSAESCIRKIRSARHRVSVSVGQLCGALDCREFGLAPQLSVGSHRQQRALRAGKFALGQSNGQPEQHAEQPRNSVQIQGIQRGVSRNSVCRRDVKRADVSGSVGCRDHRKVPSKIEQTEGEVWDILNAGPLQRYTANNCLVHNCLVIDHAGNVAGFYDATADFFENGVKSLDDRRFRDVVRAEYKPKDATCKGCGVMVPPGAGICPGCGRERKRRTEIETVAGKVIEIGAISKGKRGWSGTEIELWRACCASAMPSLEKHNDHERAERMAKARYKSLSGEWPDRDWKFVPAARVPKAVQRQISASYRAWKASQRK